MFSQQNEKTPLYDTAIVLHVLLFSWDFWIRLVRILKLCISFFHFLKCCLYVSPTIQRSVLSVGLFNKTFWSVLKLANYMHSTWHASSQVKLAYGKCFPTNSMKNKGVFPPIQGLGAGVFNPEPLLSVTCLSPRSAILFTSNYQHLLTITIHINYYISTVCSIS